MTRAPALGLAIAAVAAGVPACGLNQEGVTPPSNTFFYPASAEIDATGSWLFVANSNADLRYNDGTLLMVNVGSTVGDPAAGGIWGAVDDRTNPPAPWPPCPMGDYVNTPRPTSDPAHYCCWDQLDANILNCDERAYIPADNTVRIGSFSAGVLRQVPTCPLDPTQDQSAGPVFCDTCSPAATNADERLFVAVRGDTSLTYVDVTHDTPPLFKCTGAPTNPTSGNFATCDDDHRITQAVSGLATLDPSPNPPSIPLPNEPYALAIDNASGLLYVGHLAGDTAHGYTGGYSLFDVAPTGGPSVDRPPEPRFIAPFLSPFPANSSGLLGITTLDQKHPGDAEVFASSRYVPEVAGLSALAVCPVPGSPQRDLTASPTGDYYNSSLVGSQTRGIQFPIVQTGDGPGVERPFVLQRVPPALVEFNGTFTGDRPANTPIAVLETCSNPTFLYGHDAGVGDRLLVNCYDTGEIYVFDPAVPRLEATFQVGRGPAGLVFPPGDKTHAYVIGFGDNNISIVDLAPGSPTEYHVIQRLGFPSQLPR